MWQFSDRIRVSCGRSPTTGAAEPRRRTSRPCAMYCVSPLLLVHKLPRRRCGYRRMLNACVTTSACAHCVLVRTSDVPRATCGNVEPHIPSSRIVQFRCRLSIWRWLRYAAGNASEKITVGSAELVMFTCDQDARVFVRRYSWSSCRPISLLSAVCVYVRLALESGNKRTERARRQRCCACASPRTCACCG